MGNSANADGITAVPVGLRWQTFVGRVPQDVLKRPADASRWWVRRACEEMKARPGPTLTRFAGKGLAFFNRREFRNNICYHYMQSIAAPLKVSPLQYAVVLPLAICGMVMAGVRGTERQRLASAICGLWVAGYWITGVAFFVTARFRLPAVPFLILAASWAAIHIARAIRQKNLRTLAGHGAILLAAGVICWPMWFGSPQRGWVRDHVNLGNSLRQSGDLRGAMDAHRQALTYEPDDPDAHYLIALQLLAREPAAALEHLDAARKVLPDSPSLLVASARAQLATGRVGQARRTLHLLLELQDRMNLWPARESWSMAHILLADIEPGEAEAHWEKAWSIHRRTAAEARFLQRQDLPRVLEAFRDEAKEKPWDWYSQANLGLALLETGQPEESVPQLRKAVRLAPEREAVRFQLARALLEDGRNYAALRILDRLLQQLPNCPLRRQVHDLRDRAALQD